MCLRRVSNLPNENLMPIPSPQLFVTPSCLLGGGGPLSAKTAVLVVLRSPLHSSELNIEGTLFPQHQDTLVGPVLALWLELEVEVVQQAAEDHAHLGVGEAAISR